MTTMDANATTPEGGDAPFTEEELATVRRMCSVLRDMGLGAALTLMIAEEHDAPEQIIDAVGVAMRDILSSTENGQNPEGIVGAAISLAVVAPLLAEILEDDFVPPTDVIDRWLKMFFAKHRAGTAS
jgi:hypothetical protein